MNECVSISISISLQRILCSQPPGSMTLKGLNYRKTHMLAQLIFYEACNDAAICGVVFTNDEIGINLNEKTAVLCKKIERLHEANHPIQSVILTRNGHGTVHDCIHSLLIMHARM